MILMIDNYDSFTYNVVQYLGELGARVEVRRNDSVSIADVCSLAPDRIVISPGPGRPENAGVSVDVIQQFFSELPILGVCLGHQAIGVAFGGTIQPAAVLVHGKSSTISHDGLGVFRGIETPFSAGRYHSLVVSIDGCAADLEVVARADSDGSIMGIRHKKWPVHGVQFHPESVLTEPGKQILQNFLDF